MSMEKAKFNLTEPSPISLQVDRSCSELRVIDSPATGS